MAPKRKKLTLEQKIKIIEDVKRNPQVSKCDMAKKYDLVPSSLAGILKNQEAIINTEIQCGSVVAKRKNIRASPYKEMESILVKWFERQVNENVPIDGNLIREKAKEIALKIGLKGFTASNGWFDRFKNRHNLSYRQICGESLEVDGEVVQFWKETALPRLIEGYEPKDIFNADETGVFFNLLPSKSYSFRGDKCYGGKRSKERLTALLCVNSDGSEKLPPLIIGKFKSPRCFKNVKTLPCKYESNSSSWMTSEIFVKFLRGLDAKMGAAGRKILLIIDKCPSHKDTSLLRHVKVAFLPANCTSELQPLDLGIIHSVKSKYRKALVQKAILFLEQKQSMKLNILQAMHLFVSAWEAVTKETIQNCFKHGGFQSNLSLIDGATEDDDDAVLPEEWKQIAGAEGHAVTFEEFVSCDNILLTASPQSDVAGICAEFLKEKEDDEEEDIEEEEPAVPSFATAVQGLDAARRYFSSFNVDGEIIRNINSLERQLLRLRQRRTTQTTLLQFFKK